MTCRIAFFAATAFAVIAPPAAAQLLMQPTPPPIVTAENELWFQRQEPITHNGNLYLPAGPEVFFDPRVMVRTGSFRGIPLYVNRTRGPLSPIYVPLPGQLMQPYVRQPLEQLGGIPAAGALAFGGAGIPEPQALVVPRPAPAPEPELLAAPGAAEPRPALPPPSGRVETAREPAGLQAIYVEWSGARWRGTGPPTGFDPERFIQIGEHGGFPVYALRGDLSGERIFLPIGDAAVTRYERMP